MTDESTPCHIYALCDPRTGEMGYVGQTVNLPRRFGDHLHGRGGSVDGGRGEWLRVLAQAGCKPGLRVLEVVPLAEAGRVERQWIARLIAEGHPLTNLSSRPPAVGSNAGEGEEFDPDALTVKEAATEKGVHLKSVYRAMAEGRLRFEEQYGVKLIRRRDLEAWQPKGPGPRKARGQDQ